VSASLDDMPAYEHFQDELDLELLRYAKRNNLQDLSAENEFIEFICFSLFLSKPAEVTLEILKHFFNEHASYKYKIESYIQFMNEDEQSFLKQSFSHILTII